MNSNFNFLRPQWPEIFEMAMEAEKTALSAPRTSAFHSRLALENAIYWLFESDSKFNKPYQSNLSSYIHEYSFQNNVPSNIIRGCTFIIKVGNNAAHQKVKPSSEQSFAAVRYLYTVLSWMYQLYSLRPAAVPAFDEKLIPAAQAVEKSLEELQKLEKVLQEQNEALQEKLRLLQESEEERQKFKARLEEVQLRKEENEKQVQVSLPYTEFDTRRQFIDVLIQEAGWDPKGKNVEELEVTGMPNKEKVGYADYVLWGDNGLPLAVIEAKKTLHDAGKGKHQAKLYADCLEKMFGQRPVIFYTNGFETYIWDDQFYPPRPVYGFYTKEELQRLILRRETRKDLAGMSTNKAIADRYYQEEAIKRVADAFTNKSRGALLVMATGSGKTRTAAAIVEMLMKANWVTRVLFLADRNALVTQAKNGFSTYLPDQSTVDITKDKEDTNSRIVFSTYPTMMNRIDGERVEGNPFYGVGHFDVIIVDEAHRSVYMKYKAIFDYFDALTIGLTATPKAEIDRNTYELFGVESHVPTFAYELKTAVDDKYLVPPVPVSVPLKFHREGIKYNELTEEEKAEYELSFRDETSGEMPDEINASALNAWLFNKDTVNKVLSYLMEKGLKVEGGDKLGKTIIFAKSHKHGEFIVECFDKIYPQYKGDYCQLIDNYINYASDILDRFSEKAKLPQIAVSIDMLDTGIDIPEIVNLVFFKPVRSSAKFWQMVGRGTRLCPDLFGPGQNKKYFYIFDFCENFEFFGENPNGIEPAAQESISAKIFKSRLKLSEILKDEHYQDEEHKELRKELLDTLHAAITDLSRDSFVVKMRLRYVDEYRERARWENLSRSDIQDINKELTPLPVIKDEDEAARRFDLMMYNLANAIADGDKSQKKYISNLQQIAQGLSKKGNIPTVAKAMSYIKMVQEDDFWKNVSVCTIELLRTELRGIVKFLDKEKQPIFYTNFQDELGEVNEKIDLVYGSTQTKGYILRVEKYIRENQNHLTIRKLKTNQQITTVELEALEKILFDGDTRGTKEEFIKEVGKKPLGVFIRSIIGLDVKAAKEAFSEFLSKGNLTADQITFINNIIDHLTRNGTIDPEMLYEPPFTDIHHSSLNGLFEKEDVGKIISIIERVNGNAVG